MISLSFRCAFKIVNTVGVPQFVIFTHTKSHIKGSLEKIGREPDFQPDLLKGEIEHSNINKSLFTDFKQIWESYLRLDVLCLAFIDARHSMKKQKRGGCGTQVCLT